jgi:hypothetical protein
MARGFIQGWVEQGGNTVLTDGRVSTDKMQQSYPLATVTVFNAGTAVLSTIFSTEAGAPLANPFLADSTGKWGFWADQARYDVQFSGAGITSPYTLFNLETVIAAGLVDPGSNGILARTALNTLAARTILGTTSEIVVANGNGSGNPVISLDTGLNFSGKTITGGTYVGPSIANFSNAQHNHENATGGGQLNATNVFSAGTVPILRLPAMVGASGVSNGSAGLVPQPLIGDESKFLRGDGTYQTAGGGGGSPGGSNTTIQYNNSGAFGGVSGATSDGTNITFGSTNLRATRPRIITSVDDTNGNELIGLVSTGSAVNEVSITNAATGTGPSISVTGGDANPNLNISAKGSGVIATVSNIQISNNAPQIAIIDANDSKTVRIALNGANWDFINDTAGNTPININTTSSVVTFFAIPVGPAANPTAANELSRKQYIDDQRVRWSVSWSYPVLPPAVETTESVQRFIVPDGQSMFIEDIVVVWAAGSDSGASNIFTIKKRNSSGTVGTDVGTIDVNTPAQNALNVNNITDYALTLGDQIYPLFTTRNTASEQMVTISIRGYQKSKTT